MKRPLANLRPLGAIAPGVFLIVSLFFQTGFAQLPGGTGARFGVDGGLYSGITEFQNNVFVGVVTPTDDWFKGSGTGHWGVIDQAGTASITTLLQAPGNPVFEVRMSEPASSVIDGQIWIDAVYARDHFGGTGFVDPTSYTSASKNGQDPAVWATGSANVLGKNDLIDVAGHMRRSGATLESGDLWFFGLAILAEPGGTSYLDFEFFMEEIFLTSSGFTTGGPQMGHTAFQFDTSVPGNWKISKVGDFIFSTDVSNSGMTSVDLRIWVSRTDFNNIINTPSNGLNFTFTGEFDGAFNTAPFGYARIAPKSSNFGQTNSQSAPAPPWGHRGTKSHVYTTNIGTFAIIEMGVNLTEFGIDHVTIEGLDECNFPINTYMVKTRASASFTAQLKDFAGPYGWGRAQVNAKILGDPVLSCLNTTTTLIADPIRDDVLAYNWTTPDGIILTDPSLESIQVGGPGTYFLDILLPTGCWSSQASVVVGYDPSRPFFTSATATPTVACLGNNGTITLAVSGGTPAYSYLWSNGATTQSISGLTPGTYNVTVTDAFGCTITSTATVPAATPIVINETITHVDCFGRRNGSISLSVSGKGPFTYQWSNGSISPSLSSLGAGSYTVTITDADGCTRTETYTITQPPVLTRSLVKADATNNNDPGNGSITLTVGGGTPAYSYVWVKQKDAVTTSPYSTDQNLSGLTRGLYSVTVTDGNGCTTTASINIWEPEICDDGIDNSGNGLTDCQDPVCKPANPGVITPSEANPCVGDTVTYSVVNIPSLTGYIWSVPPGATIIAGLNTHSITIEWTGDQGGQICVQASNVGCLSDPSCITVSPSEAPAVPNPINIQNN